MKKAKFVDCEISGYEIAILCGDPNGYAKLVIKLAGGSIEKEKSNQLASLCDKKSLRSISGKGKLLGETTKWFLANGIVSDQALESSNNAYVIILDDVSWN